MRVRQSELKAFGDCAYQYYLGVIMGREGQVGSLTVLGTVWHYSVDVYETYGHDLDLAKRTFDYFWENPGELGEKIDFWHRGSNWNGLRKRGLAMLEQYHSLSPWRTGVRVGTEIKFTVPIGDHELTGTIDKLWVRRGQKRLEVVDFKCVTPDTLITKADGSTVRADSLVLGDKVLGAGLESQRVVGLQLQPPSPLLQVKTKQGRLVSTTIDHPFWTLPRERWVTGTRKEVVYPGGWVEAGALKPGMFLASIHGWDKTDESGLNLDDAYFLGLLVGDGSLTGGTVSLACQDGEIRAWCEAYAKTKGLVVRETTQGILSFVNSANRFRNPLHHLVKEAGLWKANSRAKRVPQMVMRGGAAVWQAYLSGYLDADGTVRTTSVAYPMVSYSSINRLLLGDTQELLARLGVHGTINPCRSIYNGNPYSFFQLNIRQAQQVRRVARILAPVKSYKRDRLAECLERLKNPGRLERDRDYDEVAEVVELAAAETIGLTVEGTHTHYTAGLLTHNTGAYVPEKLKFNLQFTAYCLATEMPEFWQSVPGFEDGHQRFANYKRGGWWYHARNNKMFNAGDRTEEDYRRLHLAIVQMNDAIEKEVFPLSVSGETCGYCPYSDGTCGSAVPDPRRL